MLFVFQYWNQKIVSKSRNLDFVKSYILRILIPEAPLRANKLDNLLGGGNKVICKQKYSNIDFVVLPKYGWVQSSTN